MVTIIVLALKILSLGNFKERLFFDTNQYKLRIDSYLLAMSYDIFEIFYFR